MTELKVFKKFRNTFVSPIPLCLPISPIHNTLYRMSQLNDPSRIRWIVVYVCSPTFPTTSAQIWIDSAARKTSKRPPCTVTGSSSSCSGCRTRNTLLSLGCRKMYRPAAGSRKVNAVVMTAGTLTSQHRQHKISTQTYQLLSTHLPTKSPSPASMLWHQIAQELSLSRLPFGPPRQIR